MCGMTTGCFGAAFISGSAKVILHNPTRIYTTPARFYECFPTHTVVMSRVIKATVIESEANKEKSVAFEKRNKQLTFYYYIGRICVKLPNTHRRSLGVKRSIMFPRGSAGLNSSSCDIYDHFDILKGNFSALM